MENLNAEKVKKALEIHTGILDMPCEECPYNCDAHDEICLDVLPKDALALINSQEQRIKELTEERDGLYRLVDDKIQEIKKLTEENEKLTRLANLRQRDLDNANDLLFKAEDENERLRADTVRKMQERIKQYIDVGHYRSPTEICFSELDVANIIDQIAKEILNRNKQILRRK